MAESIEIEKHMCKLRSLTYLIEPDEKYYCGACSRQFDSICRMHYHMKFHNDEGSYIFDNTFKIAFPKYETTCSFSQTDPEVENSNKENVENACSEMILTAYKVCLEEQSETNQKTLKNDSAEGKTEMETVLSVTKKAGTCKYQHCIEDNRTPYSLPNCVVRLRNIEPDLKGKTRINMADIQELLKGQLKTSKGQEKESGNSLFDAYTCSSSNATTDKHTFKDDTSCSRKYLHDNHENDLNDNGLDVFNYYLSNPDAFQELQDIATDDSNEGDEEDFDMHFDNIIDSPKVNEMKQPRNLSRCDSFRSVEGSPENEKSFSRETQNSPDTNVLFQIKQETTDSDPDVGMKDTTQFGSVVKKSCKKNRNKKKKAIESKNVEKKQTNIQKVNSQSRTPEGENKRSESTLKELCEICGLEFNRKRYKYHLLKHRGERPYLCNHCGRSFFAKKNLITHLCQHQEVKPHTCSLCSTGFPSKNALDLHMNIHTKSRPYRCGTCDKAFNHGSNLRFHIRSVHLDERKYECSACKQKFKKKSHLNVHVLIHSAPSFECPVCSVKMTTQKGLKRHMDTHSSQVFKCVKCRKKLPVLLHLYLHMERCHKIPKREGRELWKSGAIESESTSLEGMSKEEIKEWFRKVNKGTRSKKENPSTVSCKTKKI